MKGSKMAKQKIVQRKIPRDGYIAPKNPANVLQNTNPTMPPLPDCQIMPVPPAAGRHVVEPPAPGALGPAAPAVP
jgi:hypothetical protein